MYSCTVTDWDSGAALGFILPSSSWTAQFQSAHAAAGNKDILQAQDCTTGTLLGCGGSCCQLQAGLLLLRMWCQAVMCSITHHDVIPYVIASVCRFWASWPFRLRPLYYRNSVRHGCRVIYIIIRRIRQYVMSNFQVVLHSTRCSSIFAVLLHNVHSGTGQTRKATRQSGNNNMIFCAAWFSPSGRTP